MEEINQENQEVNDNRVNVNQNTYEDDTKKQVETEVGEQPVSTQEVKTEAVKPQENDFFKEESFFDNAPPVNQQPFVQPQQQYRGPYQQPPQFQQPNFQQPPQQQFQQPPHFQQQGYYQPPINNGQFIPPQPAPPPMRPVQPLYTEPPKVKSPKNPDGEKKKKLPVAGLIAIIIGALLIVGLVIAIVAIANNNDNNNNDSTSHSDSSSADNNNIIIPVQPKPDIPEKYKDADGRYTTQGIAKVVSPSVVGVVIYGQDQSLTPISQASGIIINSDGYIATNAHVIEGAHAQKVILSDGKEYEAKIIGRDVKSDLAVLKIEATSSITPAELGDSSELELGEQVMAIGNPGGLSNSITGGFVSGLDRKIKGSDTGLEMNCIQTDAAVNPGNSGGALVNMYGQVVGIISSKLVATDYEGIGFAISTNDALPILNDIMSKGYVSNRIRIGIVFQEMSETTADMYDVVPGLYISDIDPSCDVANSGLKVNDIITEMNGKKVYNYQTVMKALQGLKPGDEVTAKVYRKTIVGDVSEIEIKFKLMEDTSGK